jgi:outer membrane protein OmpA-like peptidoglycan-associated protein
MKVRQATAALTAAALLAGGAGCASTNKTERGGAIGAGAGGVLGAIIGHETGSTARGAIIGAVVGGAAGAVIGRRMDQQAERLQKELKNAQVSRVGEGIAITFASGILFPFDSAELEGAGADNLRKLAMSLRDEPRTEVLIVGHTDAVGEDEYNRGLSDRRSDAAAAFLGAQGITRSRVRTDGKGEQEPVASNDTDDGRQRNRRVEIAIFASREWRDEARKEAGSSSR